MNTERLAGGRRAGTHESGCLGMSASVSLLDAVHRGEAVLRADLSAVQSTGSPPATFQADPQAVRVDQRLVELAPLVFAEARIAAVGEDLSDTAVERGACHWRTSAAAPAGEVSRGFIAPFRGTV